MRIDGENTRLVGIDACELGQPARLGGALIDCGIWARDSFREMIGPRSIRCESTERDVYDRPLAICYTDERELNRALVENGYVFPYARGVRLPCRSQGGTSGRTRPLAVPRGGRSVEYR